MRMGPRRCSCILFLMLVCPIAGFPGEARKEKPTVDDLTRKEKFLDTVADTYIRTLTRQYQLSPEQADRAKQIYSVDSWKLQYKVGGQMELFGRKMHARLMEKKEPSVVEVRQMVDSLYPLLKRSMEAGLTDAQQFHTILNDKQKKLHQEELDKMQANFKELTEKLERWRVQGLRPGELQACFADDAGYRMTSGKKAGDKKADKEEGSTFKLYKPEEFDFWELYVKEFIQAFELDRAQATQAWSVLSEMKVRGARYQKDHAREYAQVRKDFENLRTVGRGTGNPSQTMAQARKEIQQRLDALNQPLLDIFEELKVRLMKIPTDAQRKRAIDVLSADPSTKEKAGARS